ncbi:MAG: hypothetical protein WB586_08750 [Chthoniobacterales bacterium]
MRQFAVKERPLTRRDEPGAVVQPVCGEKLSAATLTLAGVIAFFANQTVGLNLLGFSLVLLVLSFPEGGEDVLRSS